MSTQQLYMWRRTLVYYGTLEQIKDFQLRRQLKEGMVNNSGSIVEFTNLLDVQPLFGTPLVKNLLAEASKLRPVSYSEAEDNAYHQALANFELLVKQKGLTE